MRRTIARIAAIACAAAWLIGCAGLPTDTAHRTLALLPADAILLGEQHDAPDHQRIHSEAVQALAAQGQLAALVLEMAEQGHSTTGLPRGASAAEVQAALAWNDAGWPWAAYGPAVMAAVQAGVPVLGANLPRTQMRDAMANTRLDGALPGPALKAQQQAIRLGHCGLLPESQIGPMTRIQIARDQAMAQTLQAAAVPGKTVLLLAGAGHVDGSLGIPQYLPENFKPKTVLLQIAPTQEAPKSIVNFDSTWVTPSIPATDYCADLQSKMPG
ncbi:ChaN family lipoprotein [Rhodoferax sp.]|uniref:ChaN family lipoprotein n=1 Tax=Rhodoferax sp. TaxID=50421 RepID=UPI0025DC33F4|nr:ChaN family lipoprotein [Rhodoferax sp.]